MERIPKRQAPLIGKPFELVELVKQQHVEDLMSKPLVNGVGVGRRESKDSRQFVITVYLKSEPTLKQKEEMPQELDGVPVLYEVIGEVRAL